MEITKLMEEVKANQEAFKKANDAALAQKADKGYVDHELKAKVDALNGDVTSSLEKLSARVAEIERNKQIEEALGGAHKKDAVRERMHEFALALSVKAHDPKVRATALAGLVTPELLAAYESGFDKIARSGWQAARLSPEERAAMEVGSDPKGGLLLPPQAEKRVVELQHESTPMRQICRVERIAGDSLPLENDLNRVEAGWVGERAARPETDTANIGEREIELKEIYANPSITQKLLDMGKSPAERLAAKVAMEFSLMEAAAFVTGNVPTRPRGFTTYAAGTPSASAWNKVQQVNSGASGAFASSNPGDKIIDLVHALKSRYVANARFLMARLTLAEARKLKDGQGNYLWQADFAKGINGTLLGFPITIGEDMAALAANSLSIAFGDFLQGYTIVDGIGIRVLVDPFTNKPYVHYYSTKNVGGDVENFEAIKLMKFAA